MVPIHGRLCRGQVFNVGGWAREEARLAEKSSPSATDFGLEPEETQVTMKFTRMKDASVPSSAGETQTRGWVIRALSVKCVETVMLVAGTDDAPAATQVAVCLPSQRSTMPSMELTAWQCC